MPSQLALNGSWDDLRVFSAVAAEGSAAAAAGLLGLDVSTVSRRITRLEEQLGRVLFQRTPHGMQLSRAGRTLAARVERAAAELGLGLAELGGDDFSGPTTVATVTIASPPDFASLFLVPLMGRALASSPGIEMVVLSGVEYLDIGRQEADIGVRTARPSSGDLSVRRLLRYRVRPYASEQLLAGRRDRGLEELPWISFAAPERPEERWRLAHAPGSRVAMRVNELATLRTACAAGLGAALLPDAMARFHGLTPLQTSAPTPEAALWAVAARASLDAPAVRVVWELLGSLDADDAVEQALAALSH